MARGDKHTLVWMLFASLALLLSPVRAQETGSASADRGGETAAVAESGVDPALASPQRTMRTFLDAMQAYEVDGDDSELGRAAACLELSGILSTDEARTRLVRRVHATLMELELGLDPLFRMTTIPRFPSVETLPAGATRSVTELVPASGGKPVRLVFRTDDDGAWKLSSSTVEWLEARYAELHPNPIERLARDWGMDWLVTGSLLGMAYYLWAAIFAVILIGVVIDFVVREIVRLVVRRAMHRDDPTTDIKEQSKAARKAAKPFGMAIGGLAVYLLLDPLELPAAADGILRTGAKAFAMASAVWSAYRVVDVVSEHMQARAEKTTSAMDDLMIPLVRKAVKLFILAFGLVFIAEAFSLPITSLVAGLGIGGLAFAFAAKDTIENLFGSIAVILDRPFAPGDWIVVEGIEGVVEELGFRSTRVRTFYNSLVTIPNSTLVRATVDNYGQRRYRRFKTHLSLTYGSEPERIEQFCEGVRELVRTHPHTRKDSFEVHLNRFSAASVDVLVYIFFRVPDWSTELSARHKFMLDVMRLAKRVGVDFAFPTQTLHVFNETDTPAIEPEDVPSFDPEANRTLGVRAAEEISARPRS